MASSLRCAPPKRLHYFFFRSSFHRSSMRSAFAACVTILFTMDYGSHTLLLINFTLFCVCRCLKNYYPTIAFSFFPLPFKCFRCFGLCFVYDSAFNSVRCIFRLLSHFFQAKINVTAEYGIFFVKKNKQPNNRAKIDNRNFVIYNFCFGIEKRLDKFSYVSNHIYSHSNLGIFHPVIPFHMYRIATVPITKQF